MSANLPTELVRLLRFQILDARNGAISGEPDAIRLCGAAADEIERLEFIQRDFHNVGDIAEIRRLRNAIQGYVRSKRAGDGSNAHYWWTLQEIAKEPATDNEGKP